MNPPLGHQDVLDLLQRTVSEGRPAHSYLFTGREGIGKKLVAMRFAAMLNCPQLQEDLDASCNVCRRICAEKHPDVIIEKPLRGMIRIDRVRSIQGFFQYAPVEARYRVAVIDDAHSMNRSAQNALLKTLEEPPMGRMLLLVTSKPFLLLPTVRSRCRRIRFGPIEPGILAKILEERGLDPKKASLLAGMSSGSVARALEINTSNFLDLRRRVIEALTDSRNIGIRGNLELSTEISKDRSMALNAIGIALSWVRDLLVAREGSSLSGCVNSDLLDRIVSSAEHHTREQLFFVYDELVKASDLIESEINVNRNLVMDVLLLRIRRMLAGASMGILARSSADER
ncbi:MAG TPA: DNA polymerase III subunit delta' [Desulfomonilaceae bacterium]|nr:DNA polymerase III subunit delta' [Desulfomonilaceae bacterium]